MYSFWGVVLLHIIHLISLQSITDMYKDTVIKNEGQRIKSRRNTVKEYLFSARKISKQSKHAANIPMPPTKQQCLIINHP